MSELEAVTYNTLWMGQCVLGKMYNICIKSVINCFNYAERHIPGRWAAEVVNYIGNFC